MVCTTNMLVAYTQCSAKKPTGRMVFHIRKKSWGRFTQATQKARKYIGHILNARGWNFKILLLVRCKS